MRETVKPANNKGLKGKDLPPRFQTLLFPGDEELEVSKPAVPQVESRCTFCGSVVGKGRSHKCSKATARENKLGLVRNMSLKSKERTARDMLVHIFDEKGV